MLTQVLGLKDRALLLTLCDALTRTLIAMNRDSLRQVRQHTSAYVSIRQHTSAYVSIRRDSMQTLIAMNRDSLRQVHQFFIACDLDDVLRVLTYPHVC